MTMTQHLNKHTTCIRPAHPADANALRALTHAAYGKYVEVLGREPLPMRADFARAVRDHRIDVIETDGAMIALVEMIIKADHLWVENIAVHPDHQRRGLGRICLCHVQNIADELQIPTLKLYTNALMRGNVSLYQEFGFIIEKREKNDLGTVVHMVKSLI